LSCSARAYRVRVPCMTARGAKCVARVEMDTGGKGEKAAAHLLGRRTAHRGDLRVGGVDAADKVVDAAHPNAPRHGAPGNGAQRRTRRAVHGHADEGGGGTVVSRKDVVAPAAFGVHLGSRGGKQTPLRHAKGREVDLPDVANPRDRPKGLPREAGREARPRNGEQHIFVRHRLGGHRLPHTAGLNRAAGLDGQLRRRQLGAAHVKQLVARHDLVEAIRGRGPAAAAHARHPQLGRRIVEHALDGETAQHAVGARVGTVAAAAECDANSSLFLGTCRRRRGSCLFGSACGHELG